MAIQLNSVFVALKFKIYLFTYMDSAVTISMDDEFMPAGQLVSGDRRLTVGRLVTAKML